MPVNIIADNAGKADVRNIGFPATTLLGEFVFSNSYPTGGEEIDLSNYFSKGVLDIRFAPIDGKIFEYNPFEKKVIARQVSDGSEVTNGTDLSGITNSPEIQSLTVVASGGTFDIGVDGTNKYQANYNVADSTLKTNLGNLDDVETPSSVSRAGSGTSEDPYVHTIKHADEQGDSNVVIVDTNLTDVPQVTTVTIDATGGTFTLTVGGEDVEHSESTDLAYNIAAADLKTAINALESFSGVDVSLADSVYTITFAAGDGAVAVVADGASLTGGAGTAEVETTTAYAEASVSLEKTQEFTQKGVSFVAMGWA